MEKRLGKELEFLSLIKRDGTGTIMCGGEWNPSMKHPKTDDMSYLDNETFTVRCLSLTNKTYIACGFNSFIVRLKDIPKQEELPFPDIDELWNLVKDDSKIIYKNMVHKEVFRAGVIWCYHHLNDLRKKEK